jgi:hypothetical protein
MNLLSRHLTPTIGLFIAMWTLLQVQEPIHPLSQSNLLGGRLGPFLVRHLGIGKTTLCLFG